MLVAMVATRTLDTDASSKAGAIAAICPYLLSDDAMWRAATPSRDHRCTAVQPATPLSSDKQRQVCLVTAHRQCSTYLAAQEGSTASARGRVETPGQTGGTRTTVRTAPLLLDQGHLPARPPLLSERPRLGQAALLMLMAAAFALFVIVRLSGSGNGSDRVAAGAVGSQRPLPSASPRRSASPRASAVPLRTLVPSGSGTASAGPGVSAPPPASPAIASYKVVRGDTLNRIAGRFGTTAAVLMELNGIKDPSKLRIGQVLDLP